MHEHQTSVECRKQVVDDDLFPLSERPEVEPEDAAVAFRRRETLACRDDLPHQVRILAEARYGGQQPAVTCRNTGNKIQSGNGRRRPPVPPPGKLYKTYAPSLILIHSLNYLKT